MTSYNQDDKVGRWAHEKLKCLGDYLSRYTQILKKQHWCQGYFYIDAFAGAGVNEVRKSGPNGGSDTQQIIISSVQLEDVDEKEYVLGSAHVALQITNPFTKYFFIELAPDRIKNLELLKRDYAGRRNIEVIPGKAEDAIERILHDPKINWKKSRGIVFLDPFGMQVPWRVIEDIAANGSLEILLNLPVGMAIQRFLPNSGKFTPEQRDYLNAYFGTPEWEDVIYEKSSDMFGDERTIKIGGAGERIALWYRERLQKAFGYSAPPRLITNTKGAHLYYLLFAGPNETGAKIASHILKQGKSLGNKHL